MDIVNYQFYRNMHNLNGQLMLTSNNLITACGASHLSAEKRVSLCLWQLPKCKNKIGKTLDINPHFIV